MFLTVTDKFCASLSTLCVITSDPGDTQEQVELLKVKSKTLQSQYVKRDWLNASEGHITFADVGCAGWVGGGRRENSLKKTPLYGGGHYMLYYCLTLMCLNALKTASIIYSATCLPAIFTLALGITSWPLLYRFNGGWVALSDMSMGAIFIWEASDNDLVCKCSDKG